MSDVKVLGDLNRGDHVKLNLFEGGEGEFVVESSAEDNEGCRQVTFAKVGSRCHQGMTRDTH